MKPSMVLAFAVMCGVPFEKLFVDSEDEVPLNYIGCFDDILEETREEHHVLPDIAINYQASGILESCVTTCRMRGFRYAGVRVKVCYCGNSYDTQTGGRGRPLEASYCEVADCGMCGGDEANAVYQVCPDNTFGPFCEHTCHCTNIKPHCDAINGRCAEGGCQKGWVTPSCSVEDKCYAKLECQNGGSCRVNELKLDFECVCPEAFNGTKCEISCPKNLWGEKCVNPCHCAGRTPCNILTGMCPHDLCDKGFLGPRCALRDLCLDKPCSEGSTCYMDDDGDWRCHCAKGFFGRACNYDASGKRVGSEGKPQQLVMGDLWDFRERREIPDDSEDSQLPTHELLGCFRDVRGQEDLRGAYWIDESVTPDTCSKYCLGKGFTFAAIRNDADCRCDNSFGKYGIIDSRECSVACVNDDDDDDSRGRCPDYYNDIFAVCPLGYFGKSCGSHCHCAIGQCNLLTGACPYDTCEKGWKGKNCAEEFTSPLADTSRLIVRLIMAYTLLIGLISVWAFYAWRNKRNYKKLDIEADEDDDDEDDITYDYSDDLHFQEDYRRLIEKLAARFNQPLPVV